MLCEWVALLSLVLTVDSVYVCIFEVSSKLFACLRCRSRVSLLSKQVKSAKSNDKKTKSSSGNASTSRDKTGRNAKMSGKPADANKFALYFDFKAYITAVKPHQVSVLWHFSVVCNVLAFLFVLAVFSNSVVNLRPPNLTSVFLSSLCIISTGTTGY